MEVQQLARVYIYTLSHPITNEVRYIGKANDCEKRLKSHIRDSLSRKTPVYDWINKLKKENLTPVITPIIISDSKNWKDEEIKAIKRYKDNGYRLLNVAIGGDEPCCPKEVLINNGIKNKKNITGYINRIKRDIVIGLEVMKKTNGIKSVHEWICRIDKKTINKNKNQDIVLDFIKRKYNYEA